MMRKGNETMAESSDEGEKRLSQDGRLALSRSPNGIYSLRGKVNK